MIIYLCAFKKKEYIEEAKICIESIKKNGNFNCRKDIETNQVMGMKDFKVKKRFKY